MTNESQANQKAADTVERESQTPSRSSVFGRVVALGVTGVVAAVLAQLIISAIGEVFRLPPELDALGRGGIPGPEDQARIAAGNRVIFYKHSALWIGSASALIGGSFGLILGLFRRSRGSVLRGVVGGTLVGGLFGCVGGPLAVFLDGYFQSIKPRGAMTVPDHQLILMHAATWLAIGVGIGIGVGLGASVKRKRAATASMVLAAIGGMLGGALYLFVAGIVIPLADTTLPIPEGASERMLWLGLPSLMIGLALGRKG